MVIYNDAIQKKLNELDVYEFGFSKTELVDSERAKLLPYAISIVVPLSDYIIDEIDKAPTYAYFQHYRTVNAFIDHVLLRVGMLIKSMGYKYLCVAASQSIPTNETPYSALISHKACARAAGLGTIGKSALFLSNKYGPRVRLGTILTDMPFECGEYIETENPCKGCNLCAKSCPAMAIRGNEFEAGCDRDRLFDANACSEYMKSAFQKIGRGAVCGICMKVCPRGIVPARTD